MDAGMKEVLFMHLCRQMCSIYLVLKRLSEEMVVLVNCPDSNDGEY